MNQLFSFQISREKLHVWCAVFIIPLSTLTYSCTYAIELMINKLHGLSPSGGLVSPSGGFASLLFDQVGHFASIKLCLALSHQGAIIKIPVVRCHYLWCLGAQCCLVKLANMAASSNQFCQPLGMRGCVYESFKNLNHFYAVKWDQFPWL